MRHHRFFANLACRGAVSAVCVSMLTSACGSESVKTSQLAAVTTIASAAATSPVTTVATTPVTAAAEDLKAVFAKVTATESEIGPGFVLLHTDAIPVGATFEDFTAFQAGVTACKGAKTVAPFFRAAVEPPLMGLQIQEAQLKDSPSADGAAIVTLVFANEDAARGLFADVATDPVAANCTAQWSAAWGTHNFAAIRPSWTGKKVMMESTNVAVAPAISALGADQFGLSWTFTVTVDDVAAPPVPIVHYVARFGRLVWVYHGVKIDGIAALAEKAKSAA